METHLKSAFNIRKKLLFGFSAISLLFVLAVIISLILITRIENFSTQVVTTDLPTNDNFIDLNTAIFQTQLSLENIVLNHDANAKTELLKNWENIARLSNNIDTLSKNWRHENLISTWQNVKTSLDELKAAQLKTADTANIQLFTTDAIPALHKTIALLNEEGGSHAILDTLSIQLNHNTDQILKNLASARAIEILLLIFSVIASLSIALFTSRKIVMPLRSAIRVAKKIANGERQIKITATTHDETGELLAALNAMQKAIKSSELKLQENEINTRELFDNIVKSAKLFSTHSSQVAAGDLRQHLDIAHDANENDIMIQLGKDLNKMTDNLATITHEITQACNSMVTTLEETRHAIDSQSSGASEQASSINEITTSISEIEKSSLQTMEKAKMLGEISEQTRTKGQIGLEAVEQSVKGMKEVRDKVQLIAQTILDLSNQTQQVGEITAVVNNLAQQSKMLALNASIEAAKAGEAGKGFAVVAVEVKNLAEQSEQSTAQVQKILEDIRQATEKAVMVTEEGTKGVDQGTLLVEQAGDIIRNLTDVIHEANIASQQIEAAIRQESAGIEQITVGMTEINQVTTSFVESAKQSAEAMDNLANISKTLKKRIDTYKI